MRARHLISWAVLVTSSGCIHVNERVVQRDTLLGEAQVLEQRDQPDIVIVEADYADAELGLTLQRMTPCQRRYQVQVNRQETTQRRADPGSYIAMALEGLGGTAAILGSVWVFTARDVQFQGGDAGRVLNGLACLGLSGGLLGALGYHVYYILDQPVEQLRLDENYWSEVETCAREPLRRSAVTARIGAVQLKGTSDELGQLRLRAPDGVDLGSVLAGANWRLNVQLASPRVEQEVNVYRREPGGKATLDTPIQPATLAPTERVRPEPEPASVAPSPDGAASAPAAAARGVAAAADAVGDLEEPPLPEGPPEGAVVLPPEATD